MSVGIKIKDSASEVNHRRMLDFMLSVMMVVVQQLEQVGKL